MAFDELNRRQRDIAARRRKKKGRKKFSLLLAPIVAPSSFEGRHNGGGGGHGAAAGRGRCMALWLAAAFLLVLGLSFGRGGQTSLLAQSGKRTSTVRNKYWKANVVQQELDGGDSAQDRGDKLAQLANSSRPFAYIGDLDPTKPQPWPEDEKDWWSLHEALVQRVEASDAAPPLGFDITEESRLPQLVFFGDSITEGWGGTSFGHRPGKHRMWTSNEHEEIRQLFAERFGKESDWGQRALKPPLVLGISGSRTYDFLWRIENGEFPTSQLLEDRDDEGKDEETSAEAAFRLDKLERVYVVLMGTNNIGGGMLPDPTVKGMDAVGRAVLELHKKNFPRTPAAMLFSELLPRRDDFRAARMCPPRCLNETTLEPYASFAPAIEKVNRALPGVVDGWRKDYGNSKIVLLSSQTSEPKEASGTDKEESESNDYEKTFHCGREMFAIEDEDDFDSYMPDRLHPNSRGYELWSHCIRKGLEVIMDRAISLEEEAIKTK